MPLVALAPDQPPLAVQDVALEELQVKLPVADPVPELGEALIVQVGEAVTQPVFPTFVSAITAPVPALISWKRILLVTQAPVV